MRALLLFFSLLVASGAAAQNPPGPPPPPDSTSAWRYYPLHLGDVWQYRVQVDQGEVPPYVYTLRRRVEADTLVAGRTYAVVQEWAREVPAGAPPPPEARRYLARFDTLSSRVATREIGAAEETLSACALSESFPRASGEQREVTCADGGLSVISGGYAESVAIGAETYTLTAKTISRSSTIDRSETYAAGVGLVRSAFEEAGARTLELVTARIQGRFYGDAPEADFPGIPDTTDAARYYPLAVGDLWQYRLCDGPKGLCVRDEVTLTEVIGTESVGDTTYAVVRDKVYERTGLGEGDYLSTGQSQRLVRFDRRTATVRVRNEADESTDSCPLDADLEGQIQGGPCDGVSVTMFEEQVKAFTIGEMSQSYQLGVGLIGYFSGFSFSEELVYSRVGGVERGTPVPVVDVAGEAQPLATTLALTAFPNPTAGPLAINVTGARGPVLVEAFDAIGRRVLSREIAPEARMEIDASGWAPGVYVLRATSGERSATARVVRR
ncbi:T9SS type A sorting domain-containing protein [Rubricoccus marinus]|uniref:Uncharacterized protein n=1 Tax=Rubricoccus marinus TaxID=716817 RepID=A0A259U131_9BACT|nr:T9SS type A sorting domain-containing protein [Rubricoccus marinus]OZC03646.1 hypothetical protein BSZ36_12030 [Rubricoccus marinus]